MITNIILIFLIFTLDLVFSLPIINNGVFQMSEKVESRKYQDEHGMTKIPNDIIEKYMEKRRKLMQNDDILIGYDLHLNINEEIVNKEVQQMKAVMYNEHKFLPSHNYLNSSNAIKNSDLFKFLKNLPKGAALHVHDVSLYDADWMVQNVTYRPGLFFCNQNYTLLYKFAKETPNDGKCSWKNVTKERQASGDIKNFDLMLRKSFTLTMEDIESRDQVYIWKRFLGIFNSLFGVLLFSDVFSDYVLHVMQRFYADNVQYAELRMGLLQLYDINGKTNTVEETFTELLSVAGSFCAQHKEDCVTPKFIVYTPRIAPPEQVAKDLAQVEDLMVKFPGVVLGYDLVGPENSGHTLLDYLPQLLASTQRKMNFFFHAGETDWMDTRVDQNLFDAVLLDTKRIGHGYALPKHPILMEEVQSKGIAIEVNPISNQVLGLVQDLRNHYASILFSQNFPVVVSSDDPGIWGASPLSDDWFMALVALGGQRADLRTLKKLALNSIQYSGMSKEEKVSLTGLWQKKWDAFIQEEVNGILRR